MGGRGDGFGLARFVRRTCKSVHWMDKVALPDRQGDEMAKSTEELINTEDPGWPVVLEWINGATRPVEVFSAETAAARQALYSVQVSTRSPMGAIA